MLGSCCSSPKPSVASAQIPLTSHQIWSILSSASDKSRTHKSKSRLSPFQIRSSNFTSLSMSVITLVFLIGPSGGPRARLRVYIVDVRGRALYQHVLTLQKQTWHFTWSSWHGVYPDLEQICHQHVHQGMRNLLSHPSQHAGGSWASQQFKGTRCSPGPLVQTNKAFLR